MDKLNTQNWNCNRDENNFIWLTLDKAGSKINSLNVEILEELLYLLQNIQTTASVAGLVIQSAKHNNFIAGADIEQFNHLETPDAALNIIQQGQSVFKVLADLPYPTVALIQGHCLGGGFELALACRYRVAIEDPKTQFGLPEVKLGIHPGWGGTVRLPRLIGGLKALELIISGRALTAPSAYKMGIVDAVVPLRQAHRAVNHFLLNRPKVRVATWVDRITNLPVIRPILGAWLERKIAMKVNRAHYPAPFAAVLNWIENDIRAEEAFAYEANSISQLMMTDTSRNLVRVFYLQEKLKNYGKIDAATFNHVHVVGAGTMGGDIAAWCALKGIRTTLQDQNVQIMAAAFARALDLFKKHLKEPHQVKAAMDRLMPDPNGYGIRNADLIIEAIVEKIDAKKALFAVLAREAKKEAIFATNTSTIPLEQLSADPKVLARLIGLHFFNPVAKMPLVEVITSDIHDSEVTQKGMAFIRTIEKLPLPVKSAPGFLVNRILMPYLLESIWLIESGIPPTAIDKAAEAFGMPMGPIELIDTIGLDVCLYGAESLRASLGGTIPQTVKTLVEAGHLGKKTNQGFYTYKNGKVIKQTIDKHYRLPEDVTDRLILSMVNSAMACLGEKIIPDRDCLDAGMIFGTGFPPFRGGLMNFVAESGEPLLLQKLNLLAQRYGERFTANSGWNVVNGS